MIISRSTHVAAEGIPSFCFTADNTLLCVCAPSLSPAGGHSGCFHVLAMVNSAARNIEMQVSFPMTVFFPVHIQR